MIHNPATSTAWLLPPRCASRATRKALKPHGYDLTGGYGRHHVHVSLLRSCTRVVCNIRHPLDVLVSWWSRDEIGGRDLETWLRDTLIARANGVYKWMLLAPRDKAGPLSMFGRWLPHATHLVHFEHLEAEASAIVGASVRVPLVRDEQRTRDGRPWASYYTPGALAMALEVFGGEVAALGYEIPARGI